MNNELKFTASIANCYTENDVLTIGIGDDPSLPKNYLIISRFDDDNEIDDSIGIQTNLTEYEVSNAIKSLSLSDNILVINIRENKIIEVNVARITVELKDKNINIELLKEYISRIFLKSSTILNIH